MDISNVLRGFHIFQTSQQSLMCSMCYKVFSGRNRRQHLDQHVRTHTGEKPFMCPFCPKRTSRRDHLKLHIRNVHKELSLAHNLVTANPFHREHFPFSDIGMS